MRWSVAALLLLLLLLGCAGRAVSKADGSAWCKPGDEAAGGNPWCKLMMDGASEGGQQCTNSDSVRG